MHTPFVHVLVINWNGREHLDACFRSLLDSPYEHARFVLVDNGSDDGSVAFVREAFGGDPRVEILALERNLGWSGGNNAGIRRALEAGADYVLLLNNDTWTDPNALSELVARMEAEPDLGALAPKMLLYDQPELLNSVGIECSVIGVGWDRGLGRADGPKWDAPVDVAGVCGGACFLRCSAIDQVGLLPEDYGIYLDDLELCLRLWNAGFRVQTCPSARVRHKFSATMGKPEHVDRKYYLNTRNRFRLLLRNYPLRAAGTLLPALVRGEAKAWGRAALDGAWRRIGAHLRAYADALGYLPVALRCRAEYRRRGIATCRFWDLVRRDPLFFPGIELPVQGWYRPREREGRAFHPMAPRAWVETHGRPLRGEIANWYPELGLVDVTVCGDGVPLTRFCVRDAESFALTIPAGTIEFRAQRLFDADDTGEGVDIGGWFAFDGSPPTE